MKDSIHRLALLSLIIVGIACFFSVASASAVSSASSSPTLENAVVTPENGLWGSTFTFTVTYTEANGSLPAPGYPKLYLDNTAIAMEENNPADNDVTDGKVYFENWTPVKENIGPHNFYFYVETLSGENARTPVTGTYEGPGVEKRPMSLICEVDNPEPAAGETITFRGYLRTADDNSGKENENIILYKLFSDNYISMGSATTDENGYFTLSPGAPGPEISCYIALFPGDNYLAENICGGLYSITLDKSLIFGSYTAVLIAIVGVAMFLLRRGITRTNYLMPVLIGFALGFFLIYIEVGVLLGILAGGAITGYLFAKKAPGWTKHLRIGCITGLLFLLTLGLISVYAIVTLPPEFLVIYSITQTEIFTILFYSAIFYLVYYSLFAGAGAALGGMLRKVLKPAEQKPPSGSEETTSSGVEQQ